MTKRWLSLALTLGLACLCCGLGAAPALAAGSPSVSLSSTAAGAAQVAYTIDFTARSAIPAGGTISVLTGRGTLLPQGTCSYSLTDSTTSAGSFSCAQGVSLGDPGLPIYTFESHSGSAATVTVPNAIDAGDSLQLVISGVGNPGTGHYALSLDTSSSASPQSASYAITSANPVSSLSLSLSTTAADAEQVSYTAGFTTSSTGAIPAGGTITLSAAPGTLWPSGTCDYVLTDSTTPGGSFSCAKTVTFDQPGLQVFNFESRSGSVVTITVPNAIDAGDSLSLAVAGVQSPASGGTLSVHTSADPAPASTSYSLTAAKGVASATLALSTTAASATQVTYTAGFKTSSTGAIAPGGYITLVAAPGTLFPTGGCNYALTDSTTPSADFTCAQSVGFSQPGIGVYFDLASTDNSGSIVTIQVPNAIKAGDALSLAISGVANPGAGSEKLQIATSSDSAPASVPYTLTAPNSTTSPLLSLSSEAAGQTDVSYQLGFSTSSTGGMPAGGTITLVGPPGTVWNSGTCDYSLIDTTHSAGGFSCASSVKLAANGATVTISVPNAIAAGDSLTLDAGDVTNPGGGSYQIMLDTSADPVPVASGGYSISGTPAAPTSVGSPSLSRSTTAGDANAVTYTVSFIATSEVPAGGVVTLAAPGATVFGACPYGCSGQAQYTFDDETTSSGSGAGYPNSIVNDGATVDVGVPGQIDAGDHVVLTITRVTNPPQGAGQLTISTTGDQAPVPVKDTTAAARPVTDTSLSESSTAAGANGVTYTVDLTTSSLGEIVGGNGSISLDAPAGTVFGTCPYGCGGGNPTYTIDDLTHSSGSGSAYPRTVTDGGADVDIVPSNTVQAGDQLMITITQVTNPTKVGTGKLTIATSSDKKPVTVDDVTSALSDVSSPSLSATTTAAGANGVTYTVQFTTSSAGAIEGGLGSISLAASPGTVFGTCPYGCGNGNPTYTIDDLTHSSGSGSATPTSVGDNGAQIDITPSNTIAAGDTIVVTITQVTNPPTPGTDALTIATSSDKEPETVDNATTAAKSVSSPTFSASSDAGGATDVTYTVGFTTSATGELLGTPNEPEPVPQSTITLIAPPGTTFSPSATATITDSTNSSGSGTVSSISVIDNGTVADFGLPNTVQAGDAVTLTVEGVTNPPHGPTSLSVATTSDKVPVSVKVSGGGAT